MDNNDVIEAAEIAAKRFIIGLFTGQSKIVITRVTPCEDNRYTEKWELSLHGPPE